MTDHLHTLRQLRQKHKELRVSSQVQAQETRALAARLREIEKLTLPPIRQRFRREKHTKVDAIACVGASDWHIEEPVDPNKIHGLNKYDLGVAEARARKFFINSLKLAQGAARDSKISTLHASLLGDFITGYIHEELRESNLLGPGDAANFVLSLLDAGLRYWLKESDFNLEIDAVPGNHGRMTLKPRIQNATETSLETFMYRALARGFIDEPRVRFNVAESKMVYRQFFERFTMRLVHGDAIKYNGGVGGVTVPILRKTAQWDRAVRADLTVLGHFHQLINGGSFIVNGSLIGYNEFAQEIGASPEEPRQAFWLVHARNGGQVALNAPVWVEGAKS
jgi:hypothetical protein